MGAVNWVLNFFFFFFFGERIGFSIEFKYLVVLNLIIFRKGNVILILLINVVKCLNLIEKLILPNLQPSYSYTIKFWLQQKFTTILLYSVIFLSPHSHLDSLQSGINFFNGPFVRWNANLGEKLLWLLICKGWNCCEFLMWI